jgi:transcriptional regulator with XRE-family HTH domain
VCQEECSKTMSRSAASSAIAPRTRLHDERVRRGLSQAELAERVGTTFVNVSRWERGITGPNPYFRKKLVQFFGLEAWELDLDVEPGAVASLPSHNRIFDSCIPDHPPRPLIGRNNLLTAIRMRLCACAQGQVVALQGMPGVGKTTLAWALTYSPHIGQHFQGGVLWTTLGPSPSHQQLLARWAAALHIPETTLGMIRDLPELIGTLRNAIGVRRMLLVIDDAWSNFDANVFRVGGPNCTHLVTTRFRSVAALAATPPGAPIQVSELSVDESLALLQRMAPETKGCDASRLKTLARSVGGLPLALKQAGSYLHRAAAIEGPDALPAALQRLSEPGMLLQLNSLPRAGGWYPGTAQGLSPTLEAGLAPICQVLSEPARSALAALASLPPKPHVFSENEALAAAHCSLDTLDELIDAGVLEPCQRDAYALHALFAAYARVLLAQGR